MSNNGLPHTKAKIFAIILLALTIGVSATLYHTNAQGTITVTTVASNYSISFSLQLTPTLFIPLVLKSYVPPLPTPTTMATPTVTPTAYGCPPDCACDSTLVVKVWFDIDGECDGVQRPGVDVNIPDAAVIVTFPDGRRITKVTDTTGVVQFTTISFCDPDRITVEVEYPLTFHLGRLIPCLNSPTRKVLGPQDFQDRLAEVVFRADIYRTPTPTVTPISPSKLSLGG